jgi:hypothetical protein
MYSKTSNIKILFFLLQFNLLFVNCYAQFGDIEISSSGSVFLRNYIFGSKNNEEWKVGKELQEQQTIVPEDIKKYFEDNYLQLWKTKSPLVEKRQQIKDTEEKLEKLYIEQENNNNYLSPTEQKRIEKEIEELELQLLLLKGRDYEDGLGLDFAAEATTSILPEKLEYTNILPSEGNHIVTFSPGVINIPGEKKPDAAIKAPQPIDVDNSQEGIIRRYVDCDIEHTHEQFYNPEGVVYSREFFYHNIVEITAAIRNNTEPTWKSSNISKCLFALLGANPIKRQGKEDVVAKSFAQIVDFLDVLTQKIDTSAQAQPWNGYDIARAIYGLRYVFLIGDKKEIVRLINILRERLQHARAHGIKLTGSISAMALYGFVDVRISQENHDSPVGMLLQRLLDMIGDIADDNNTTFAIGNDVSRFLFASRGISYNEYVTRILQSFCKIIRRVPPLVLTGRQIGECLYPFKNKPFVGYNIEQYREILTYLIGAMGCSSEQFGVRLDGGAINMGLQFFASMPLEYPIIQDAFRAFARLIAIDENFMPFTPLDARQIGQCEVSISRIKRSYYSRNVWNSLAIIENVVTQNQKKFAAQDSCAQQPPPQDEQE